MCWSPQGKTQSWSMNGYVIGYRGKNASCIYKRSLDQFKVAATSSPCETLLHRSTRKAKKTITKNKTAKKIKQSLLEKKWWWQLQSEIPGLERYMVATARDFCHFHDLSLTNWINNFTNFSPDNGLHPPLTAIPLTHLFMLWASHVPCTWIDSS